jgi:hypothetical protein
MVAASGVQGKRVTVELSQGTGVVLGSCLGMGSITIVAACLGTSFDTGLFQGIMVIAVAGDLGNCSIAVIARGRLAAITIAFRGMVPRILTTRGT